MGVEPHPVRGQQPGQPGAEPVRRDAPEVRDRTVEAAEGAGRVERPAAGVGDEPAVGGGHEIEQRLAGDDDETSSGHAATVLSPA